MIHSLAILQIVLVPSAPSMITWLVGVVTIKPQRAVRLVTVPPPIKTTPSSSVASVSIIEILFSSFTTSSSCSSTVRMPVITWLTTVTIEATGGRTARFYVKRNPLLFITTWKEERERGREGEKETKTKGGERVADREKEWERESALGV